MDKRIILRLLLDAKYEIIGIQHKSRKDTIAELSLGSHKHNNKVKTDYISCHYDR